jgi:hypothetical protein
MTTHKQIVKALEDLGAKEWSLSGDNIADIVWLTNDVKTETEITAAIANPLPDKTETAKVAAEAQTQAAKAALLERLGLTEEEARLLLS